MIGGEISGRTCLANLRSLTTSATRCFATLGFILTRRLAGLGEMLPLAMVIEHRRLPPRSLLPRREQPPVGARLRLVFITYELAIWYDITQRK
jgi:hypothetical protein